MEQLGSHWADFREIWYLILFRKFVEKIQVSLRSDKNNGHFTCIFRWIVLRMKNVSGRACRKIKTHILCSTTFFPLKKSYRLWGNVEKYCRVGHATDGNTIGRIGFECCIIKATNTHSEYIIPIVFPLQQLLHERASILRYTYTACLAYRMV